MQAAGNCIAAEVWLRETGLMGSYDYVHGGRHCAQVKCWGKGFREITPGDPVVLHVQVDQGEFATAEGGSSIPPDELFISGKPDLGPVDYQVPCNDGSVIIVRDGCFAGFEAHLSGDLPRYGNDGRPFDGSRPAWAEPSGDCEVCVQLG